MRSAVIPGSIRRAGRALRRISGAPCRSWKTSYASAVRVRAANARRVLSARSASLGPTDTSRNSRARSTARSSGRRAARGVSATIPCSCPPAIPAPSARCGTWRTPVCRRGAKGSRTGRARFSSSRRLVLQRADRNDAPAFGVYVHWPFCLSKCPYCDFNSHVRHAGVDEARFARAFTAEIAATAARVPARTVSTIFFGGRPPSLMQPATVGAILDAIARYWPIDPDVEVTLEANPTSVEAMRFRGFRAAGINRVSLGVQALDDAALKELGRLHSAREALDAVAV